MSLEALCKQHGLRLTKPRQQVFRALQDSAIPLSISQLVQACRGIDRTSVYRTIETFGRLGVVKVVHLNWKNYYELAEPFMPHHHHLFCIKCRNAQPLQDDELEQLVQRLSDRYQFRVTQHHFELEGICAQCQRQRTPPAA